MECIDQSRYGSVENIWYKKNTDHGVDAHSEMLRKHAQRKKAKKKRK